MTRATVDIRQAVSADHDAVWRILEPVFRAGDTYCVEPGITRDAALGYWLGGTHTAFIAENEGRAVGTCFLCPNQSGNGAHVANAAFATAADARGLGVARAMLRHVLEEARQRDFLAMQFNFVVSTNEAAIGLWKSAGFDEVGRLPGAFRHPRKGHVDALVMYRAL